MPDEEVPGKRKRMTWGLSSVALLALAVVLPILWIMVQAKIPALVAGATITVAVGVPICGAASAIVGLYRDRRRYVSVIGLILNARVGGFWCYWGFAFYIVSNLAT